ncbi:hypothetical protein A2U01_0068745, partial [Trifolium medium]|nr:hypothetical protein [Trifolium medium]
PEDNDNDDNKTIKDLLNEEPSVSENKGNEPDTVVAENTEKNQENKEDSKAGSHNDDNSNEDAAFAKVLEETIPVA